MPLFYGKKQLEAIVHRQQGPQAVTQRELVEGLHAKRTQIPPSSQILLLCVSDVHKARSRWWRCYLSNVHVGIPGLQAAAMLLLRTSWWKHSICHRIMICCQEIPSMKMHFLLSKPKGITF